MNLEVLDIATNNANGFVDYVSSNGAVYSCRFTGGVDGAGGVQVIINSGAANIRVVLLSNNYRFQSAGFKGEGANQLSLDASTTGKTVVVKFKNTELTDVKASYNVVDTRNGSIVPCDPPIVNKPPVQE